MKLTIFGLWIEEYKVRVDEAWEEFQAEVEAAQADFDKKIEFKKQERQKTGNE